MTGKALPLDPPDLEQESQISDGDIAVAVALWKQYAPAAYRSIIDGSGNSFMWDADRLQYSNKAGKYISAIELRNSAVEPFLARVKIVMRELDAKLQSKAITLTEWHTQMITLVKSSQIAASLVAIGGTQYTEDVNRQAIAASILAMLIFLQDFAKDIESGKQPINGLLLSRTDLYANSLRDAYEEARRNAVIAVAVIAGAKILRERRVLAPGANHCVTDGDLLGCVELAKKGWQPIGTLPRLYATPCRSNCLCHFEYG